VFYLYTIT